MPGANGGANIPGGLAVDPETGILYTATTRGGSVYSLVPGSQRNMAGRYRGAKPGPFTMNYVQGPGGARAPRGCRSGNPLTDRWWRPTSRRANSCGESPTVKLPIRSRIIRAAGR